MGLRRGGLLSPTAGQDGARPGWGLLLGGTGGNTGPSPAEGAKWGGRPHLQPAPRLLSPLSGCDLWPFPCLSPSSSPPAKKKKNNNNPGTKEEIGSSPPRGCRPRHGSRVCFDVGVQWAKAFDLRRNSSFLALLHCLSRTKGPPRGRGRLWASWGCPCAPCRPAWARRGSRRHPAARPLALLQPSSCRMRKRTVPKWQGWACSHMGADIAGGPGANAASPDPFACTPFSSRLRGSRAPCHQQHRFPGALVGWMPYFLGLMPL